MSIKKETKKTKEDVSESLMIFIDKQESNVRRNGLCIDWDELDIENK